MSESGPRLLVLGAHPDDAEYHAGGLACVYRDLGRSVKLVSVTDGSAGHQTLRGTELAGIRRREAQAAGEVIGAEYETWDFPDGFLQPTLDVRARIIAEIRRFQPDLVLTHRLNDYHPDHRAVAQAVQDACYLVTVPAVVPEVPALRRDPVVASMIDLFTKPCRLQADAILDLTPYVPRIVEMMSRQASQFFDWLPYNQGTLDRVPTVESGQRMLWLRGWFGAVLQQRRAHFAEDVRRVFKNESAAVETIEVYEISEYASRPDPDRKQELFPECRFPVRD